MMMRNQVEELCSRWEAYVRDQPDHGGDYRGYYAGHDACAFQLRAILADDVPPPDLDAIAAAMRTRRRELIAQPLDRIYGELALAALKAMSGINHIGEATEKVGGDDAK